MSARWLEASAPIATVGTGPYSPLTAQEVASARLAATLRNPPVIGTDLMYPGSGVVPRVAVAGTGWTLVSQGFEQVDNEDWYKVVINGTGAGIGQIDFFFEDQITFAGDSIAVEFMYDMAKGGTFNANLSVSNNFAVVGVFTNNRIAFTPSQSDPLYHSGRHAQTWGRSNMSVTNSSFTISAVEPIIGKPWKALRFRNTGITSFVGQVTMYLRSVRVGVNRKKGRLCITADDGYHSFFRRGAPILARYNLVSTASIISSAVGTNLASEIGFATLRELQNYVAAGNFCVAHGTNNGDANLFAGSLAGGNERNADRIAQMNENRDYLLANRLCDEFGAKCYVWPQGVYSSGSGDVSLLDAAYEAGYRLCRAATAYSQYPMNLSATSPRCHSRMATQIIGHTYAGTTNSPDNAAETTNINNIIAAIQALATSGMDGFLMLHRVVDRGTATAGGIDIETDRLAAICAAIQPLVAANTLECVGMPEMML